MSKNTHIHEKNNQPVGFGGMQLGIQVQLWVIGIYGYGSLLWFLTYTAGLTSGLHCGSQLGCRAGWAAGPVWLAQACTLDRTAFSNLLIMSIDLCLVSRNYFVVSRIFFFEVVSLLKHYNTLLKRFMINMFLRSWVVSILVCNKFVANSEQLPLL